MPRDSGGNYTLPPGNPVASGTVISTTWANPTMDDLALALTESLSRAGNGGMLVPFQNADGNVLTPGITFATEPGSGIYRAGTEDIRFSISGDDTTRWIDDSATPVGEQRPFEIWNGSSWDAVAPVTLINDQFLQARNFADDGFVDLIKANTNDEVEIGTVGTGLLLNGAAIIGGGDDTTQTLYRKSKVQFNGLLFDLSMDNSDDLMTNYARIQMVADTVTAGAEDGRYSVFIRKAGTLVEAFRLDSGVAAIPNSGLSVSGVTSSFGDVNADSRLTAFSNAKYAFAAHNGDASVFFGAATLGVNPDSQISNNGGAAIVIFHNSGAMTVPSGDVSFPNTGFDIGRNSGSAAQNSNWRTIFSNILPDGSFHNNSMMCQIQNGDAGNWGIYPDANNGNIFMRVSGVGAFEASGDITAFA